MVSPPIKFPGFSYVKLINYSSLVGNVSFDEFSFTAQPSFGGGTVSSNDPRFQSLLVKPRDAGGSFSRQDSGRPAVKHVSASNPIYERNYRIVLLFHRLSRRLFYDCTWGGGGSS